MKKVNLEQRYIIELKHSIKFKTSMPGKYIWQCFYQRVSTLNKFCDFELTLGAALLIEVVLRGIF